MYVEQKTGNDISVAKSEKYNVPIFDNIHDALTLGTDRLQCDAVLSVGEHGNYESTEETHQVKYPDAVFSMRSRTPMNKQAKSYRYSMTSI